MKNKLAILLALLIGVSAVRSQTNDSGKMTLYCGSANDTFVTILLDMQPNARCIVVTNDCFRYLGSNVVVVATNGVLQAIPRQ